MAKAQHTHSSDNLHIHAISIVSWLRQLVWLATTCGSRLQTLCSFLPRHSRHSFRCVQTFLVSGSWGYIQAVDIMHVDIKLVLNKIKASVTTCLSDPLNNISTVWINNNDMLCEVWSHFTWRSRDAFSSAYVWLPHFSCLCCPFRHVCKLLFPVYLKAFFGERVCVSYPSAFYHIMKSCHCKLYGIPLGITRMCDISSLLIAFGYSWRVVFKKKKSPLNSPPATWSVFKCEVDSWCHLSQL